MQTRHRQTDGQSRASLDAAHRVVVVVLIRDENKT